MMKNSEENSEEMPDPILCSTCPECGAYPLEKRKIVKNEETIFDEDCPNCYYQNRF